MSDDQAVNEPLIVEAPAAPQSAETPQKPSTTETTKAGPPLGKKILRWLSVLLLLLLLLALGYRWAGTSTTRGTVQRVYEEEMRKKVEFITEDGEVLVLENEPMSFPHLKPDGTDLHAELHRYSETGDLVEMTTWGFRASWFSVYPNAIEVEFVRAEALRKKQHVDHITQGVIDELIDQGVVERGEASERMRPGLKKAVENGLNSQPQNGPKSPNADGSASE